MIESIRVRTAALLLLVPLIVTGCAPPVAPSTVTIMPSTPPTQPPASTKTIPAPTTAPTAVSTTVAATDAPTVAATTAPEASATGGTQKTVQFHGVSFAYDTSLATEVKAEVVPTATQQLPAFAVALQHLAFTFVGYPFDYYGPEIQVFSLEAFEQQSEITPLIAGPAQELRTLLQQKPDLNQKYKLFIPVSAEPSPTSGIPPLIPPVNALVNVAAKKGYVDFANGTGFRFVFWGSQALMYVDPNFLFYTYEGLTSDGKHYVTATFPVHAPIRTSVPMPGPNTTIAEVNAFNLDMANQIEAADPASFTPPLLTLDAVMQSLQIGPEAP